MKPAMKTINGKTCVRLIDLAKAWDTTTSNILCVSKPGHIPGKYLHRIDGRVWCELEGLRYRATATHKSRLTRHIVEFLDGLEKPAEESAATVTKTEPEPTTLDPNTADLIANTRHTASEALRMANGADNDAYRSLTLAKIVRERIGKLETRMDSVEADVCSLRHNPCRDHTACHQSASATVVSNKNTGRIQELNGKLDGLADAVHGNQVRITDTAADVHVAKQTANIAFARAEDNKKRVETLEKQMDAAKLVVKSAANIAEEASEAVDRVETTAQQASDLAQENADIMRSEIKRLTEQEKRIDALEKHNTVVEALLAIAILAGTVSFGGVIGCFMQFR